VQDPPVFKFLILFSNPWPPAPGTWTGPLFSAFLVKLFDSITKVYSHIPGGFQAIKLGVVRRSDCYSEPIEQI